MFVGRNAEAKRLREAILARQSLLICGPADSGKTALLHETFSSLPDAVRKNCIACSSCESPQSMWRDLMHSLAKAEDPQILSWLSHECHSSKSLDSWLYQQSSLRLRGILRSAMRAGNYSVFIDAPGIPPAGAYRLLQEWVWSRRTPVFLLARGATERELGRVARLYWHNGLQLDLGPLQFEDVETLFEHAIARAGLTKLADSEFRDFVLARCGGFPGRIVRLCELASQSAYQSGGHLKLHTLALDFLLHTADMSPATLRADNHG
jgi:hypothetical protein